MRNLYAKQYITMYDVYITMYDVYTSHIVGWEEFAIYRI